MEDSIFTKIISGEVPAYKIYEDEFTLAFLDVYPKNEGHTLVIPKIRPSVFVWDLDEQIYSAVMSTAKKVAVRQREVMPYKYVHMAVVGTDVPYAHVHVVPFNETSQLTPSRGKIDHEALAAVADILRFE